MTDEDTLKTKIEELEKKKGELIDRIRPLNRRIRYKKFEQKALEPFLEQTKEVQIAPYRKQKRALEFKIATAAYTPKMEKELIKHLKKIDEELDKVKEVETYARSQAELAGGGELVRGVGGRGIGLDREGLDA